MTCSSNMTLSSPSSRNLCWDYSDLRLRNVRLLKPPARGRHRSDRGPRSQKTRMDCRFRVVFSRVCTLYVQADHRSRHAVPAPPRRDALRKRVEETPSRGPGLSAAALAALAERKRTRAIPNQAPAAEVRPSMDPRQQGLGDFKQRGNRGSNIEHERRREMPPPSFGGARDNGYGAKRSWEQAPTPRTSRTDRDVDGGSMRVPNRGWDETPRGGRDQKGGFGARPGGESALSLMSGY
jgi:hypothetical protein